MFKRTRIRDTKKLCDFIIQQFSNFIIIIFYIIFGQNSDF